MIILNGGVDISYEGIYMSEETIYTKVLSTKFSKSTISTFSTKCVPVGVATIIPSPCTVVRYC